MKFLNWLLYEVHRWLGIAVAIFMFAWFATGIVIMYATPTTQTPVQQLAHAESLAPEPGWLSVGDVWNLSKEQRKVAAEERKVKNADSSMRTNMAATGGAGHGNQQPNSIADARLTRIAGEPIWLIDDTRGFRFALSAVDGSLHETSANKALVIAQNWFREENPDVVGEPNVEYLELVENPVILRNQETLRPFHHVSTPEGRELLISSRTGEVLHDSTPTDRALYYAGNWLHLFKPLESLGYGAIRHDVQVWSGFIATIATITGLIIGWIRWRPGFGGKKTYSEGRKQPYREFWMKWHFWTGLIGGFFALCWALSGYIDTNPWKLFGNGDYSKEELSHYLGAEIPASMQDWKPAPVNTTVTTADIVALGWRRLGAEALLIAYNRNGERLPLAVNDNTPRFSDQAVKDAVQRMAGDKAIESITVLNAYDSYYYPRHHQTLTDKPLPVVLATLKDSEVTQIYVDPLDGKLLSKQNQSRRVFRWLYSALHHWDFGWLYSRPLWDVWMLVWAGFGVVLGFSSIIVGYRRLKKTFTVSKKQLRTQAANLSTVKN